MTAGLDAYGAIPVADLKAYGFVGRYVSMTKGKCITKAEAASYRSAGKSVVLVYEDNAGDGLGGAIAGRAKAKLALPILEDLGLPAGRPVYFAFDMPGYSQDLPAFLACTLAFAAALGRPPAAYGDVDTCTYLWDHGVRFLWQFGEDRSPGLTVYQSPSQTMPWGQSCDPDEALTADFGQWPYVPPVPPIRLARVLTGKANLLGRVVWNTTLNWPLYDHLTVQGGGPKTTAWAINAGNRVRVRVAKARRGSSVTVRVYAK